MKNTRLIALSVSTLVLIAAFFWWRSLGGLEGRIGATNVTSEIGESDKSKSEPPVKAATKPVEPGPLPDLSQASAEQNKKLSEMGITPGMTREQAEQKMREWYLAQAAKLVPEQKPIDFYGKVVDETMQPISGASVHFIWRDASATNGNSETDAASANDGTFSLTGVTGSGVSVYVSKDGYYEAKTLNKTDFDPTGNGSSKINPVLFHLRQKTKGVDLITSQSGIHQTFDFSSPRDGSSVRVDFLNRKTGSDGQMEVSQVKPAYGSWQSATSWSYRLTIPDGGFVETSEEFPFQAPESGYQPTVDFNFQKSDPNWTERLDKTYYIAFGNPRKYGRIHVQTSISSGTILQYAINPDGSQNLESN